MDDNSPNSSAPQSNIDDLVKELSRPQSFQPAPSTSGPTSTPSANSVLKPMTSPAPVSSTPSTPPRPMTSVPTPTASGPVSVPPKSGSTPVSPANPLAPATPSAPKEYQSSIRTMTDDLAKLKAGQQPQGVNVPRKIDNTPTPTKPVAPVAPAPTPIKPAPSATMPSATKSAPIPANPNQAPATPAPAPTSIPRPVMPTMPSATKNTESKLDQKNQFYVPPAETKTTSSGSGSRNIIFISIAVGIVILGGLYWFFMIRGSGTEPIATESPAVTFTPRPTATPNPDVLSTIFTNRGGAIVLPSSGDPTTAFSNAISAQPNVTQGTFTVIDIVSGASVSAQTLTASGLLNRFVASYPATLPAVLGQNYKFLLYGQKESFDSKGRPVATNTSGPRFVMINEIASSSASIIQSWEPTMSTGLSGIMAITPAKNKGAFLETSYKGAVVRFKNFPYPDRSIDYALVQYNGKVYLIVAGSREAMFSAIDAFVVLGK